jgi:putative membrane protein
VVLLAGTAASKAQSSDASSDDKQFVTAALRGGMAEVELGQLASQKGNSDDVKQFGKKMVEDHTKMGDDMKVVAGQVGVKPPSMLSPMDKALELKLKALSGDDFDKAYIEAMVKDHHKDLSDFKKEVASGQSSTVKDAASKGEKVIAEHLKMIRQIAQAHGLGQKTNSTSGQ